MWPTTWRTSQPSHSDGLSHSSSVSVWRYALKSAFSASCSARGSGREATGTCAGEDGFDRARQVLVLLLAQPRQVVGDVDGAPDAVRAVGAAAVVHRAGVEEDRAA